MVSKDRHPEQTTSDYKSISDGRRLHFETSGSGRPAVVLESGLGFGRSYWAPVFQGVAANTRVVAYDRANLGRSEPDDQPRTLARHGQDLIDLLEQLDGAPYVLVGHSLGGLIVRYVASKAPHLVGGLVLVDPSDEHADMQLTRMSEWWGRGWAALQPTLARTGMLRRMGSRMFAPLDPATRATIEREDLGVSAARGFAAEMRPFYDDLRRLRSEPLESADVPLTMISGAQMPRLGKAMRVAVIEAHAKTVASHVGGRHVKVAGSGHNVPVTAPSAVITEIDRLVEMIRGPS